MSTAPWPVLARDRLAGRLLIGMLIPSVNTSFEPECAALRPAGVSHQTVRFLVPDMAINDDADFDRMMASMPEAVGGALEALQSLAPDRVLLGLSTEALPGGEAAGNALAALIAEATGAPVNCSTPACTAALTALGARRIGILAPFMPSGANRAADYFRGKGFEVAAVEALAIDSPRAYPRQPVERLLAAAKTLAAAGADTLLQVGTNLPTTDLAERIEAETGLPWVSVTTASYWQCLREAGIDDRLEGFGRLFAGH